MRKRWSAVRRIWVRVGLFAGPATITREEQQRITLHALLDMLEAIQK